MKEKKRKRESGARVIRRITFMEGETDEFPILKGLRERLFLLRVKIGSKKRGGGGMGSGEGKVLGN
jgi:hypothetical protein